ncbi:MAG TPA: hypothetical protein VGY56_11340 [Verrucomicrobiae bacterium]|nr:hypothetical protein [Verrucomicrobiae bacterium]
MKIETSNIEPRTSNVEMHGQGPLLRCWAFDAQCLMDAAELLSRSTDRLTRQNRIMDLIGQSVVRRRKI